MRWFSSSEVPILIGCQRTSRLVASVSLDAVVKVSSDDGGRRRRHARYKVRGGRVPRSPEGPGRAQRQHGAMPSDPSSILAARWTAATLVESHSVDHLHLHGAPRQEFAAMHRPAGELSRPPSTRPARSARNDEAQAGCLPADADTGPRHPSPTFVTCDQAPALTGKRAWCGVVRHKSRTEQKYLRDDGEETEIGR